MSKRKFTRNSEAQRSFEELKRYLIQTRFLKGTGTLAAILCIKRFSPYVEGLEFASLKWVVPQQDLSSTLVRWSLKVQRFNFTLNAVLSVESVCNGIRQNVSLSSKLVIYWAFGSLQSMLSMLDIRQVSLVVAEFNRISDFSSV